MAKKIFIAATGQHRGKTACTLGIAAALKAKGLNVGYCKPVGQNHLLVQGKMVDKDVVLFEDILKFQTIPEVHSPVIIASGVTALFIKNPGAFDFEKSISKASAILEKEHDVIIFEGTGHAGVGSVVNLSNAQVAKMLGAEVILVAEGGIGRTFDRLNLNLALFREQGVPIKGVIINKVLPDKLEKVESSLTKGLKNIGISLLGVLPYDRMLSFPLMFTIRNAIQGSTIINRNRLNNQVEEILAGSSIEIDEFTYFKNLLLIITYDNLDRAIGQIKQAASERGLKDTPLSGVIITGLGKRSGWSSEKKLENPYLIKNEIPVMATPMDVYDTVVAISQIEVKINLNTPWKVNRVIQLIQNNLDVGKIL